MSKIFKKLTLETFLPYLLVVGGGIGFLAAVTLTVEKIELLINTSYIPSCNLSPILSCGSVMQTPQASVFGFPNSLLGIAGFAIVVTIGMALLAGAKFKRWFWLGLELGTLFGLVFVHWLFFQSVFVIGALCPYCIVVWTVTIPIFIFTTLYNLKTGNIPTPKAWKGFVHFLVRHGVAILFVWYGVLFSIVLHHFWNYWKSLV